MNNDKEQNRGEFAACPIEARTVKYWETNSGISLDNAIKVPTLPVQEPVARVSETYGSRFVYDPINRATILPIGMALYAGPPQREWVGLTDEQQEEMYQMTDNISDCRTCYFQGIADAEAAHNIGAKP